MHRGRLGTCRLWLLASVLLATVPVGAFEPELKLTLEEVLSHTALESSAACANVNFDEAPNERASDKTDPINTPPNPAGLTPVELSLYVLAIDSIDPSTNSFRIQAFAALTWCDPRLAFDAAEAGTHRRMHLSAEAERALRTMWWPGVFLPTQLGEPLLTNEQLILHADGTVAINVKFNARMIAHYDFSRFPLDHQLLHLPLQGNLWAQEEVELRVNESRTGYNPKFEIPEWKILQSNARIQQITTANGSVGFSRFLLEIEIGRKLGFYLWKVGLPLLLIVGVAWSVFWLTRDVLAQRQRQSATGLLTLVAYQFAAAPSLPRIPYLTLLDFIFLWSFIAVTSTMILNVLSHRKYRQHPDQGLEFDRKLRWFYPLAYLAGAGLILSWRLFT